jgi:hypothetical protein
MGTAVGPSGVRCRSGALFALLALGALLASVPSARADDEAAAIYRTNSVNVVELGLSPEAISELEAEPDEYVKGTFSMSTTSGGPGGTRTPLTSAPVAAEIRLKGSTSFEPLSGKAAFKIKFKKSERFLGLHKMTLNNMVQDPSMIHESLAYSAFRAAGVPASRTSYADVLVNGEDFGIELDLETLDVDFLEKHFGSFDEATQHLYEGEDGTDVTPGSAPDFEVDEGEAGAGHIGDLEALIAAVDAEADGPFSTRVSPFADLGEMTSMWAVEKYVGQWDGYSGQVGIAQPNNYYLYSGPTGVFQMLPSGLDETWQLYNRVPFDGEAGVLFDGCLEDESCFATYLGSLRAASGAIDSAGLDAMAQELAALLAPWQESEQSNDRHEFDREEIAAGVGDTRTFLAGRSAEAEAFLGAHEPPLPSIPGSQGPTAVSSAPPPQSCVVPKLRGRKLASAKDALRAHRCHLGKSSRARGVSARKSRVVRQSPSPGRRLPTGAKVKIELG